MIMHLSAGTVYIFFLVRVRVCVLFSDLHSRAQAATKTATFLSIFLFFVCLSQYPCLFIP